MESRAMDGYRFVGYTETDETVKPCWGENRWNNEIDSFKDGYEYLCRGDDGFMYLVSFDLETGKPYIWNRVEKREGTNVTYYYFSDNATCGLLATDGVEAYFLPVNSDGMDMTTGLSVIVSDYDNIDGLAEKFREWFSRNGNIVYDWSDISTEYENKLFKFSDDDYDTLILIAEK